MTQYASVNIEDEGGVSLAQKILEQKRAEKREEEKK